MAKQVINVGTTANDGTGDTLRASQQKANNNFNDLYDNGGSNITVDNPVTSTPSTLNDALDDLNSGGSQTLQTVVTAGNRYTGSNGFVDISADGSTVTLSNLDEDIVVNLNILTGLEISDASYGGLNFGKNLDGSGFVGIRRDSSFYSFNNRPSGYYDLATLNDIFGLKPIIITDPIGAYFTDLASARTWWLSVTSYAPLYDFHNPSTNQYYPFFDNGAFQDISVGVDGSSNGFGYNNDASIEDESGFIYSMAGNAFQGSTTINPIILRNNIFNDDNVFRGMQVRNTLKLGKCNFNGAKAFKNIIVENGKKIEIEKINVIGGQFAEGITGRMDILDADSGVVDFSGAFSTLNLAWVHFPYSLKDTSQYTDLVARLAVGGGTVILD